MKIVTFPQQNILIIYLLGVKKNLIVHILWLYVKCIVCICIKYNSQWNTFCDMLHWKNNIFDENVSITAH